MAQPKLTMPALDWGYDEPINGKWHWWCRLPGPLGEEIWVVRGIASNSGDASPAVEAAKLEAPQHWRAWCEQRGFEPDDEPM
jgi:hypothetical protein